MGYLVPPYTSLNNEGAGQTANPEDRFSCIDAQLSCPSFAGTHWIMDSLTMVLKGKAEVSRSDAIMFELFPSLDGYIQQGTL